MCCCSVIMQRCFFFQITGMLQENLQQYEDAWYQCCLPYAPSGGHDAVSEVLLLPQAAWDMGPKKTSELRITGPLWEESHTTDWWIPTHKGPANNAERFWSSKCKFYEFLFHFYLKNNAPLSQNLAHCMIALHVPNCGSNVMFVSKLQQLSFPQVLDNKLMTVIEKGPCNVEWLDLVPLPYFTERNWITYWQEYNNFLL